MGFYLISISFTHFKSSILYRQYFCSRAINLEQANASLWPRVVVGKQISNTLCEDEMSVGYFKDYHHYLNIKTVILLIGVGKNNTSDTKLSLCSNKKLEFRCQMLI